MIFTHYRNRSNSIGESCAVRADPNPMRLWALVAAPLLLSVASLRLMNAGEERGGVLARSGSPSMESVSLYFGNAAPGYSPEAIRTKAAPVLAQLSPGPGALITVAPQASGSAARGKKYRQQRLWAVSVHRAPGPGRGRTEAPKELAEVRYDADSGGLIAVNLWDVRDAPADAEPLTAPDAVRAAREWLPKLGLAHSRGAGAEESPAEVLYPSQNTPAGRWRVWLRGRDAAGGPPLTVQISIGARSGELLAAVVVERSAYPRMYLPRRAPDAAP